MPWGLGFLPGLGAGRPAAESAGQARIPLVILLDFLLYLGAARCWPFPGCLGLAAPGRVPDPLLVGVPQLAVPGVQDAGIGQQPECTVKVALPVSHSGLAVGRLGTVWHLHGSDALGPYV